MCTAFQTQMKSVERQMEMISQVPRVSTLGLGCQVAVCGAVELARENRVGVSVIAGCAVNTSSKS